MDTRHAFAPLQPPEPTPALTPTYSRGNAKTTPKLLIASAVAACLTLAACSSQPAPAPTKLPIPIPASSTPATPSASPTETPQATQTPTETPASTNTPARQREDLEPPTLSDVALENSFDGAEAYAYFLFQAWWYLINTLDVEWWEANIPESYWKDRLFKHMSDCLNNGEYYEFPEVVPYVIDRRRRTDDENEYRIIFNMETPTIYRIDSNGNRMVDTESRKSEFIVRISYADGAWKLLGITSGEAQDRDL